MQSERVKNEINETTVNIDVPIKDAQYKNNNLHQVKKEISKQS